TSTGATLNVNTIISVTNPVSTAAICPGAAVTGTFAVTASGTGAGVAWEESTNGGVSYSPLANGGVYSGVTTSTLTIDLSTPATASAMNGYMYRAVASGTCPPNATSTGATLNVNTIISVTNPVSTAAICPGASVTGTFAVTAGGTGAGVVWEESTNGGESYSPLANGGVYSGVTTSTLTIDLSTPATAS